MGIQSSRQRPRRQRVCPHVPFHIWTTLSRRLVGTHRFSPVLDLALSPCECKCLSPAKMGEGSSDPRVVGARWRRSGQFGPARNAWRRPDCPRFRTAQFRASSPDFNMGYSTHTGLNRSPCARVHPTRPPGPAGTEKRRAVACSALPPCDWCRSARRPFRLPAAADQKTVLTAASLRGG